MWKNIRNSGHVQKLASWTIALLIRLLAMSVRWKINIPEKTRTILKSKDPIILIFWHNRILSMPAGWDVSRKITLLRSPHRDGLLIGRAIAYLGYDTIAGSSNRKGADGLRKLLKELQKGRSIGITPDGPRGPRMKMTLGAIVAAGLSGVPIIPVAWNTKNRKLLGTWDQMILARPITEGIFVYGEPISIPRKLSSEERERYRVLVETKLNELSYESEIYYNQIPIEPAVTYQHNE